MNYNDIPKKQNQIISKERKIMNDIINEAKTNQNRGVKENINNNNKKNDINKDKENIKDKKSENKIKNIIYI